MIRVNIGCGKNPTNGWQNFDNTLSLKLAKSPLITFFLKMFGFLNKAQIDYIEWNKNNKIIFADATMHLPFKDEQVDVIYSSHMIEHLSPNGAVKFLLEAKRTLRSGGVLRISVPDLKKHVSHYVEDGDADNFMKKTYISAGEINSFKEKLHFFFVGFRHHQWMYDGNSLSKLLLKVGFKETFILNAGKTMIKNYGELNLYEREDESVYVEAIK